MKRRDFFKASAVALVSVPAVVSSSNQLEYPSEWRCKTLDSLDDINDFLVLFQREKQKDMPSGFKLHKFYRAIADRKSVWGCVSIGCFIYNIELPIDRMLGKSAFRVCLIVENEVEHAIRVLDGLVFSSRSC